MAETAQTARSLYRNLLRFSNRFAAYNFREYAKRRSRDAFREHRLEHDPQRVQELIARGQRDLKVLQRQTMLSQYFQLDRLVVEGGASGKQKGTKGDIARLKDTGWD
ncbi:complex 1 protein [Tricharina praecox]|uniref:complex 1 protein n=1 Tax=Tricharina praecox TaxID=43433 RepID=UPI00222110D3|nr:complex 1 protein [Tricharina praecox]KAI5846753.1 complex 1 protein [Tricharina praecox]